MRNFSYGIEHKAWPGRSNIDSPVKSRIGQRHCPFRKKGFDTGGVKNSKLFEALATSFWNLAAGVETPESGHRSEPIGLFTNPSMLKCEPPEVELLAAFYHLKGNVFFIH
jgi:hypothetical protein